MDGVKLVCVPADDASFRALVESELERLVETATALDLQAAIRVAFPHALVTPVGQLRSVRGGRAVRYVYRDGNETTDPGS